MYIYIYIVVLLNKYPCTNYMSSLKAF